MWILILMICSNNRKLKIVPVCVGKIRIPCICFLMLFFRKAKVKSHRTNNFKETTTKLF